MASTAVTVRDYHTQIPGELTPERWLFPQINSVNAHGKKTEWRIQVRPFRMRPDIKPPNIPDDAFIPFDPAFLDNKKLPEDVCAWIKVDYRIEGGSVRKSVPTIVCRGKNIGKASETNAVCQALRDALGEYNKQLRRATADVKLEITLYPPMLAQVLREQKEPPQFPLYVQRKYNGVRTVAALNGAQTILYSRKKKLYPGFQYIKAELLPVLQAYWPERQLYLDGEVYLHGMPLQDISGLSRRAERTDDVRIDFMIFDCFIANEPGLKYSERKAILDHIFAHYKFNHCKLVETYIVDNMEEVNTLYQQFLKEKYEGAMLREDATYKYSYNDYHSKMLLKMKPTLDAEFRIVGWETGERGKAAGALMIICEVNGKRFPVTPALELDARIELARKMAEVDASGKTYFEREYLNKPLIVYFDEYSRDGVPQRARTKMEIRTWD